MDRLENITSKLVRNFTNFIPPPHLYLAETNSTRRRQRGSAAVASGIAFYGVQGLGFLNLSRHTESEAGCFSVLNGTFCVGVSGQGGRQIPLSFSFSSHLSFA